MSILRNFISWRPRSIRTWGLPPMQPSSPARMPAVPPPPPRQPDRRQKERRPQQIGPGRGGSGGPGDAVRYGKQTLSPEQQAQARTNISALGTEQLPAAVNQALTQAQASGAFRGEAGPAGIQGFYSSRQAYPAATCVQYCTRETGWSQGELAEQQGPEWQVPGSVLLLAIKCDNGDSYVSIQEVRDAAHLKPKSYWISKRGVQGAPGGSGGGAALPLKPLTFTGAVSAAYDGSKPVTVPIPSGGAGEKPWRLIGTGTATGAWGVVEFETDTEGQPLSLKDVILYGVASGKKWMRLNGSKSEVWVNVSYLVEIVPGMQMYNFDGIKCYHSGDSITSVGLEFANAGEGTTVTVYGRDA